MRRTGLYLTFGSVASILFSIALSQILLGAALLALFGSKTPRRFPPIKMPLALFFFWTILSALDSGHFVGGLPQIRKFFVFATALVVATFFKTGRQVTALVWVWAGIAMLSAGFGFGQLWRRYQQAHAEGANYYEYFLDARLHGLASHWMTFGGELMIVSTLLLALALFGERRRSRWIAAICLPFLWSSLILGLTRSVFLIGVPTGAAYLLFAWKRWSILAVPLVLSIAALAMPFQVRERMVSMIRPHGNDDSNLRRVILTRTGLEMIRAHPILGVGPERVGRDFLAYVPRDIPRPLPKGWYGHLHNIYLQYAAERGLPALALILWILARSIYDLHAEAMRRSLLPGSWILRGSVAAILAIMAEGLFEHNLGDSEVLTMFLAVLSFGYIVKWGAESECAVLRQREHQMQHRTPRPGTLQAS
jgi:putative inorganic carbon (hco3(-)) transporter